MNHLEESQFLTRRETEIAQLVALGRSRKEIAYDLGIATGTLHTHLKNIFCKLKTRSMTETAIWVIKNPSSILIYNSL